MVLERFRHGRSSSLRRGLKPPLGLFLLLGVVILGGFMCGCSSMKKQTQKVVGALPFVGERLQKKVVIIPFGNTTFVPDEDVRQLFMSRFTDLLATDCGHVIWIKPQDAGYPAGLDRLPRLSSGRIDNLALAKIGRDAGINAFLLGNVVSVSAEEKEKGILIFRDTHYYESAQIGFQIYDTGTGAKLLDETLQKSMEVDGAEYDAITAKDLKAMYELGGTWEEIAADGSEMVCETLQKQPWQGYVAGVEDDNRIILSSGRDIGMTVGDVLLIFRPGEVIEGKFGQRFIVPGRSAGEIEVTSVSKEKAEARPLNGTEAAQGWAVRLK